jgi:ankyrin repeat protein
VNAQDDRKLTPLHLELIRRHVEFARMYLEHGADVNSQNDHKSTRLHLALTGGHVEFAQVLLSSTAQK